MPMQSKMKVLSEIVRDKIIDGTCFLFPAPGHVHGLSWGTCTKTLDYLKVKNMNVWENTPRNSVSPPFGNLPNL